MLRIPHPAHVFKQPRTQTLTQNKFSTASVRLPALIEGSRTSTSHLNPPHLPVDYEVWPDDVPLPELFSPRQMLFELPCSCDEQPTAESLTSWVLCQITSGLQQLPDGTRRFIAGGFAGATGKTVTAPLEAIKLQLVQSNIGAWEAVRNVYGRRGLFGFFAGNSLDVLRTIPSKSVELTAFEAYKKALTTWYQGRNSNKNASVGKGTNDQLSTSDNACIASIAGALAGMTATAVVHPLETLRTRIAISPNPQPFFTTLRNILTTEGLPGLYRGLDASMIGVIPYAALRLSIYDGLALAYKRSTGKERVDPQAALAFGALSGVVSAGAVFPLEVARRRMMAGAPYPNTYAALLGIAQKEGVGALFNGAAVSILKQAPQYAITFFTYEHAKKLLDI